MHRRAIPIWGGVGRASNENRTGASCHEGRQKKPVAWRLMTSRRNHSHTSCPQTFARGPMLDRSHTPRQTARAHLSRVLIILSYPTVHLPPKPPTTPDQPKTPATPPPYS